ncbi:MAG: hypothetical protein J5379_00515 [Clostridiales bacterium]|nr:hypothetical protein [Clostridiales bacterium]
MNPFDETRKTKEGSPKMGIEDLKLEYEQNTDSDQTSSLSKQEKKLMKKLGKTDGRNGLPRKADNGVVTSPIIDQMVNEFEEYNLRSWTLHEVKILDYLTELRIALDRVKDAEQACALAQEELDAISASLDSLPIEVKDGESKLSKEAVTMRRVREREKEKASYVSRVKQKKAELSSCVNTIFNTRSLIYEANNANRMVTEKVLYHTRQKLDYYWNFAMKKHPDKLKLPVLPTAIIIIPKGEITYFEHHREVLLEADEILKKYNYPVPEHEWRDAV